MNERRFCGMFLLESSDTLVTGVGFRWRIVGDMTGWLSGRVFARSAKSPGFEPRSSHNFSPVTYRLTLRKSNYNLRK